MLVSSAVIYGLEIVAHTKGGKAGGLRVEDANFIGSDQARLDFYSERIVDILDKGH